MANDAILDSIIPFKRNVYAYVFRSFDDLIGTSRRPADGTKPVVERG